MAVGQRPKLETPQRILEHARHAFNERGVMNVGIREIARDLDLSPGNLSYHFPTKEALIVAMVDQSHHANNEEVATPAVLNFSVLDAIFRSIMRRDIANAWLLREYVALLVAFPTFRGVHDRWQRAREERVDSVAKRLIDARLLDRRRTERALPQLRLQVLTQIMFWLPSAICAAPDKDPAASLDPYARSALALFLPYTTLAGRRQLEAVLRE